MWVLLLRLIFLPQAMIGKPRLQLFKAFEPNRRFAGKYLKIRLQQAERRHIVHILLTPPCIC